MKLPKLSRSLQAEKRNAFIKRRTLNFWGLAWKFRRGGIRRSLTKEANIHITKPSEEVNGKQRKVVL
jgi:hypothetical protein